MARQIAGELFRFGIVGLVSNGLVYGTYLALTALEYGPKTSMTLAFSLGVLQTFLANRTFTFRARRKNRSALARYFAIYGLAYILNFLILTLFVDQLQFSHAVVQGAAILGLAMLIFLLQKYWVFATCKGNI